MKKQKGAGDRPYVSASFSLLQNFDVLFEDHLRIHRDGASILDRDGASISDVTKLAFLACSCPVNQYHFLQQFISKLSLDCIEFNECNINLSLLKNELGRIPCLAIYNWEITQENFDSFCDVIDHCKNIKMLRMEMQFSSVTPRNLLQLLVETLCKSSLRELVFDGEIFNDVGETYVKLNLRHVALVTLSCSTLKSLWLNYPCLKDKEAFSFFCKSLSLSKLEEVRNFVAHS
jgi:hypothetical protein